MKIQITTLTVEGKEARKNKDDVMKTGNDYISTELSGVVLQTHVPTISTHINGSPVSIHDLCEGQISYATPLLIILFHHMSNNNSRMSKRKRVNRFNKKILI